MEVAKMAVWAHAYRYHLPIALHLPQTPREKDQNSNMSLWKLYLLPNYMWSRAVNFK